MASMEVVEKAKEEFYSNFKDILPEMSFGCGITKTENQGKGEWSLAVRIFRDIDSSIELPQQITVEGIDVPIDYKFVGPIVASSSTENQEEVFKAHNFEHE